MIFKTEYDLFGTTIFCNVVPTNILFKYESDSHNYIKNRFSVEHWKYAKIDTVNQMAFPDILLIRGFDYCLLEVKRLNTRKLVSVEDNLHYQFGQLAFFRRSIKMDRAHLLVVVKGNDMAFIGSHATLNLIGV